MSFPNAEKHLITTNSNFFFTETDIIPLVVTIFGCLFLGLDLGIIVGIFVNILFVLYNAVRPKITKEEIMVRIKYIILQIREKLKRRGGVREEGLLVLIILKIFFFFSPDFGSGSISCTSGTSIILSGSRIRTRINNEIIENSNEKFNSFRW